MERDGIVKLLTRGNGIGFIIYRLRLTIHYCTEEWKLLGKHEVNTNLFSDVFQFPVSYTELELENIDST